MIDLVVTFVFLSNCSRRKGFDACAIDSAANKALIPMTLMAIIGLLALLALMVGLIHFFHFKLFIHEIPSAYKKIKFY